MSKSKIASEVTYIKYSSNVEVVCACGNKLVTGSTKPGPIHVDICSKCHPFWTGEKRLVDTEGRVDKFERQVLAAGKAAEDLVAREVIKTSKKKGKSKESDKPKTFTLKELLEQSR